MIENVLTLCYTNNYMLNYLKRDEQRPSYYKTKTISSGQKLRVKSIIKWRIILCFGVRVSMRELLNKRTIYRGQRIIIILLYWSKDYWKEQGTAHLLYYQYFCKGLQQYSTICTRKLSSMTAITMKHGD